MDDTHGSSLKSIERYLRNQGDLVPVADNPAFQQRLRLAAKKSVNNGRLLKNGPRYKLTLGTAEARGLRFAGGSPLAVSPSVTLLPHERDKVRPALAQRHRLLLCHRRRSHAIIHIIFTLFSAAF